MMPPLSQRKFIFKKIINHFSSPLSLYHTRFFVVFSIEYFTIASDSVTITFFLIYLIFSRHPTIVEKICSNRIVYYTVQNKN